MFAEIILPLPLYSTFTYSIPDDMANLLQKGSRVLVQFGKKKYYTGIVEHIHSEEPAGYDVKPLMALLDPTPVVRFPQLKLWHWIAEYYLCSVGEVFKAAVPTGLKPESETFISLNEYFDAPDNLTLSEQQALVIQTLQSKKKCRISELEAQTGLKNVARVINSLMELGIAEIDEKVVEKYRAKKITYTELAIPRDNIEALHDLFDKTKRSQQQEKALIAYLDLSGWMKHDSELNPVSKEALLSASGISPAIYKSMVDKGIFVSEKRIINRFNSNSKSKSFKPILATLSDAQSRALGELKSSFRNHRVSLLHGLTGSGKTEIYTHLIASVLADGNQVLYLVPEISLTTQLTDRLRKVFGDRLLIYHSKFSDNERVDVWKRLLKSNEPFLILGVRSSVFLPFARLGLVIVDEEHEASFKQYDPAPRYNARDAAIMLASMHGALTILGSATPSIETYYKATQGKYGLISLTERFEGSSLPDVEIIDMREQRKKKLNKGILSLPLRLATSETLNNGSQAIIFQNRRGFAPVVVCAECGWTPKCHNCDVSLVYHKNSALLKCHYCGYCQPIQKLCPACGQNSIDTFGYGTERIAEELQDEFADYRVSRMDLDTTRNKDAYQEIIEEFADHQTDILVGTQMVTKGLDFEKVQTVGVINADTLLNFPDFRSNERAFNMLEQVAGRAGRRKEHGSVFIQTTKPSDPILRHVKNHDYLAYYEEELEQRNKFAYPPFTRIINIYLKNKDAVAVDKGAVILTKALKDIFGHRVLGPEKPFVSRVALWYIQSIMLKIESGASMKKVKDLLHSSIANIAAIPEIKTSMIYFDVDPV